MIRTKPIEDSAAGRKLYARMEALCGDLTQLPEARKSKARGFMNLNLDRLYQSDERIEIALSHYYKHESGDMIPDPDMQFVIFPKYKIVEPTTYQNALGIFQRAFAENETKVSRRLLADMTSFATIWMQNCLEQGTA